MSRSDEWRDQWADEQAARADHLETRRAETRALLRDMPSEAECRDDVERWAEESERYADEMHPFCTDDVTGQLGPLSFDEHSHAGAEWPTAEAGSNPTASPGWSA